MIISIIPIAPYIFGNWLYLIIPKSVTAVMVKPPYVAYVKPTGIKFIALDKNSKHKTIEVIQKIVGKILVNPFVVFKKPFAQIPRIIAKKR